MTESIISEEELKKLFHNLEDRFSKLEEQLKKTASELDVVAGEFADAMRPLIKHYYELVQPSEGSPQ